MECFDNWTTGKILILVHLLDLIRGLTEVIVISKIRLSLKNILKINYSSIISLICTYIVVFVNVVSVYDYIYLAFLTIIACIINTTAIFTGFEYTVTILWYDKTLRAFFLIADIIEPKICGHDLLEEDLTLITVETVLCGQCATVAIVNVVILPFLKHTCDQNRLINSHTCWESDNNHP